MRQKRQTTLSRDGDRIEPIRKITKPQANMSNRMSQRDAEGSGPKLSVTAESYETPTVMLIGRGPVRFLEPVNWRIEKKICKVLTCWAVFLLLCSTTMTGVKGRLPRFLGHSCSEISREEEPLA